MLLVNAGYHFAAGSLSRLHASLFIAQLCQSFGFPTANHSKRQVAATCNYKWAHRWFLRNSRSEQVIKRSRVKRLLTTTLCSCKMFKYNDAHRVSIHDNLNMPTSEAQCCCSLCRLLAQACASRVGDLVFYVSLPSAGQCPQKAGNVATNSRSWELLSSLTTSPNSISFTCAPVCCFQKKLFNHAPWSCALVI